MVDNFFQIQVIASGSAFELADKIQKKVWLTEKKNCNYFLLVIKNGKTTQTLLKQD
jgi:hypothetical protein